MPSGIYKRIKPVSIETRQKLSKIRMGHLGYMKGKKHSEQTKQKMSEIHKKIGSGKWMTGRPAWNKGKEWTEMKGEKHPRWVADRTKLQKYSETNKDRRSSVYRNWRLNVYKRDSYNCKINNSECEGRIIAHHILSYTKYPELRYDINNGITLCHFHHPRKREDENNLSPYFKELVGNVK